MSQTWNAWGKSWGTSWGISWGPLTSIEAVYTNNVWVFTPRREVSTRQRPPNESVAFTRVDEFFTFVWKDKQTAVFAKENAVVAKRNQRIESAVKQRLSPTATKQSAAKPSVKPDRISDASILVTEKTAYVFTKQNEVSTLQQSNEATAVTLQETAVTGTKQKSVPRN